MWFVLRSVVFLPVFSQSLSLLPVFDVSLLTLRPQVHRTARVCHCCLWEPSWWPPSLAQAFRLTGASVSGLDEAEDTAVNSLRVRGVFLGRGEHHRRVSKCGAWQRLPAPSPGCVPSAAGPFGLGCAAALCGDTLVPVKGPGELAAVFWAAFQVSKRPWPWWTCPSL